MVKRAVIKASWMKGAMLKRSNKPAIQMEKKWKRRPKVANSSLEKF